MMISHALSELPKRPEDRLVQSKCNIPNVLTTDVSIAKYVRRRLPYSFFGFVLTRVAAGTLVCTSRAYAPLPCCLPFRAGDVEPPLKFLADTTRPIYSDPTNEIVGRFFIEPSAYSDFVDPIQSPNFVFDLCDVHNGLSPPKLSKHRPVHLARLHTFLDGLPLLLHRARKSWRSKADGKKSVRHWFRRRM
jgi:hypothetical protein